MKPEIYEVTNGGKRHAWLVDSDIVTMSPFEGALCRYHAAAIELGDLEAGALRSAINPETGERAIFGPRCCHFVVQVLKTKAKPNRLPPESRGFDKRAAVVLLNLAAASNDIHYFSGLKRWDFFGPAEKGFMHPWDELKFLAAWRFSAWESGTLAGLNRSLTGSERYADMAALGYPHNPDTLRKMLARMGLVRPKKAKPDRSLYSL